ncbi:MAG TPA: SRPBCC family protein [Candidatus Saccharimonadales bacterium]|nr:SRPBCC family protein [Candidatus Saccharimonadales bacterium]
MIIDQKARIPASVDRVWAFVTDIPAVSRCVPGVEEFERIDDDTFSGALKVKVGPIGVRLQGKIVVAERDRENLTSRLDVSATEKRINSTVSAKTSMTLVPISDAETELVIHTEASILGKLGEFGQAVMRRKADQMVGDFAKNAAKEIAAAP